MEIAKKEWSFNPDLMNKVVVINGYSVENDWTVEDMVCTVTEVSGKKIKVKSSRSSNETWFYLNEFIEPGFPGVNGLTMKVFEEPKPIEFPQEYIDDFGEERSQKGVDPR